MHLFFKTSDKERRKGLIELYSDLDENATAEEAVQRDAQEFRETMPLQLLTKCLTRMKLKDTIQLDEDTEQYVLQETSLDEEQFKKIRGALLNVYGPAPIAKTATGAFVDNFSHTLGSLGPDLLNFAELVTDIGGSL